MATESPIRMSETSEKWLAPKKGAAFAPSSASMAAEELGLLQKGHDVHRSVQKAVPNRSGSAPPNMEGSFLGIDNLIARQNSSSGVNLSNFNGDFQNSESEEWFQANQTYLKYYRSNVNLNPRLPQHLDHDLNRFGNHRGITSLDNSGNCSAPLSQVTPLSTHKEESEDDHSPKHSSDEMVDRKNGFCSGNDAVKVAGQNRNLVDIIQVNIFLTFFKKFG